MQGNLPTDSADLGPLATPIAHSLSGIFHQQPLRPDSRHYDRLTSIINTLPPKRAWASVRKRVQNLYLTIINTDDALADHSSAPSPQLSCGWHGYRLLPSI